MTTRQYYSVRTDRNPHSAHIDLRALKRLFITAYKQLWEDGYFQQSFGYNCTDAGDVPGTLGPDVESAMFLALRRENLWPLSDENVDSYSEEDLFDVIEFLFDSVSKPVDGYYHSWNDCGTHYSTFNEAEGREKYRSVLNPLLAIYGDGLFCLRMERFSQALSKAWLSSWKQIYPV